MLIDTHVHLDYPDFAEDRAEVIARAAKAGVKEMISIGTRVDTSAGAVKVAEEFPNVWAAIGIHPLEVGDAPEDVIAQLRELAKSPRVVALGEIGLDYFNMIPDPERAAVLMEKQRTLFRQQLELAAEERLNVVLHTREAWEETLEILRPFTGRVRGVFHCFKGTPEQVQTVVKMGHLVSFTGMITFPEMPQLAATASTIEAGSFMVETDSPFHTPPPDRAGRCEPDRTRQIADLIAQLRGISVEELADQTTKTAREFFKFERRGALAL